MCRARCDGIDNRKRGRGARESSKTDRRGSGAGTVCLKAAVVDTARGISTQSKQRNRMRMRTSVVRSREVGGQTANLVPIVSAVVLRSYLPSRPPLTHALAIGRGVRAHCFAASTLTNQFSAQYHSRSAVYLLLFHAGRASRQERQKERMHGRILIGRRYFSLCTSRVMPYRNFCLMCTELLEKLTYFLGTLKKSSIIFLLFYTRFFLYYKE